MKPVRTIAILVVLAIIGGVLFWSLRETTSPMKISNARALVGESGEGLLAVYMTLENTGAADTLLAARSPVIEKVMVMGTTGEGRAVFPAGSKPSFAADGAHIMAATRQELQDGSFVPLVLVFDRAGEVTVRAQVSRAGSGDGDVEAGMMSHAMHAMGPGHEVGENDPAPSLRLDVRPLDSNGYRVILETENFSFFRPEADASPHIDGQGHGHLYLNGLKLQRMYGTEAVIGALPPGRHRVSVTLNTNDHRTYMVDGAAVSAEMEVDVR